MISFLLHLSAVCLQADHSCSQSQLSFTSTAVSAFSNPKCVSKLKDAEWEVVMVSLCAAVSSNTSNGESGRWTWQWIRLSGGTDGCGGEGVAAGATSHRGTQRGHEGEEKGDTRKGWEGWEWERVRKRYVGVKLSDMRQTDSGGKGHVKWKPGLWQLQGYGLHSYQTQLYPSLLKGNTYTSVYEPTVHPLSLLFSKVVSLLTKSFFSCLWP